MLYLTKLNGGPLTNDKEKDSETARALQACTEYGWEDFREDYAEANQEKGTRFKNYLRLSAINQQQVLAFTIWMANQATENEISKYDKIKSAVTNRLAMVKMPEYVHIKAWVTGGGKLLINTAQITEFIYSLSDEDLDELKNLGRDIFGRMKAYLAWSKIITENKHSIVNAREKFKIFASEPQGYHESLKYQLKKDKQNFF